MAKHGRNRRRSHGVPKGNRPPSTRPRSMGPGTMDRGAGREEPEMQAMIRRALREDHPLGLLALASSMLQLTDATWAEPFAREPADEPSRLDTITEGLGGIDVRETTAILTVFAAFTTDELARARIRRVLATRRQPLPIWLERLGDAEAFRAIEMVHILGDGDNVLVGVRLADRSELTLVVYIDHNVGTLVKDAFVIPAGIAQTLADMERMNDDPDTRFTDIALADARARIDEAITVAAMTFPRFESDEWPACRPLVEWATRLLPPGGTGYRPTEWTEAQQVELAERFFASPCAAHLSDPDHRSLLDSILWFGCDYGPGDPLRWSPVNVEILLADWFPRKVLADDEYLLKMPAVLRSFIRFCHAERGLPARLTDETLRSVDRWEPVYRSEVLAEDRPADLGAYLAQFGTEDPPDLPDDLERRPIREIMLDHLRARVGSEEALRSLDASPLPDEDFDWSGIPTDVHEKVREILELADRCCEELFDVELRTACRRLLAQAASGDPQIFRRKARSDIGAAAITWRMATENNLLSFGGRLPVKELLAWFGLKTGSVAQRAATITKAAGYAPGYFSTDPLGDVRLLVSTNRAEIIEVRDRYEAMDD